MMSDDQVGCEWVSVSSGTGLPGLSRKKAVKRLCVCVNCALDHVSLMPYAQFGISTAQILLSSRMIIKIT